MTAERRCAKAGCETLLGPGGGVLGLCFDHALKAALEALEGIAASTGGLQFHLMHLEHRLTQIDTELLQIEQLHKDLVRGLKRK